MPNLPASTRYTRTAQAFHWLIAALVVLQFVLAWKADDLPLGMHKLALLARHKSFGMTILMLAVLRLAWRLFNPPPPLPASMSRWERILARGTHAAFYVLLFAMPLTGWLMSSAKNYSVSWFGLFTWPNLIAPNPQKFELLISAHEALAFALLGIAILHVLAAFKHHFWDKDDVLRHMLPITAIAAMVVGAVPLLPAAAAAAAAPGGTQSSPSTYVADPAGSRLDFTGMQAGAEFKGVFHKFTALIDLAPDDLAHSHFDVQIDLNSVDTLDKDRDKTIKGPDIFDTANTPSAHYVTKSIVKSATGFSATGTLTLRGATKDVPIDFQFSPAGSGGKLVGSAALKRLDFGVGRGDWKSTEWIGDEVKINFSLALKPKA